MRRNCMPKKSNNKPFYHEPIFGLDKALLAAFRQGKYGKEKESPKVDPHQIHDANLVEDE